MLSGITHYICAVDGGGTGCRAAIAQPDGTVLARGTGGPANYTTFPAQAAQSVLEAVNTAARQMESAPDLKRVVAHVGLAGILTPQDGTNLARHLPFATCTVSDDRMTSALGVLGDRNGAVLAIGTGSFVAARRGAQVTFWGGWGFVVGDQASGAWLGRKVLEHCLYAAEALAPHTDLTRAIMARFSDSPAEVAAFAAQARPSDFATFAPDVMSAAKDGDPVGYMIVSRGADYLNTVLNAAGIKDTDAICLTGGVGPHYAPYLHDAYRAKLQAPNGSALDGALHLARQKLQETETQP